ncbi:MAG: shikimate kinase [Phycisphaerales bacterium]|nr:shikimate kinase [Phycisphaerales bacterium]
MTVADAIRHIVLIGCRGSGKTTVGRRLAAMLDVPHVDTDEVIETEAGKSIAEIFAAEGESGFRRRESIAVERAADRLPSVISLGGGAVMDESNMRRLAGSSRIVYLSGSVDVLAKRIAGDPATRTARPSLTGKAMIDEIGDILAERDPVYRRWAELVVDTDGMSPDEIAAAIRTRFRPILVRCGRGPE